MYTDGHGCTRRGRGEVSPEITIREMEGGEPLGADLSWQVVAGRCNGKLPVLHAMGRNKFVGDFLDQTRLAAHNQHLQAIVVVEMDMDSGDDDFVMVVLDVRQCGLNMLPVVVVNESNRAGDFLVAKPLPMLDEPIANHVGNGQRAVLVTLFVGHMVELIQQSWRQGHAEAGDRFHFHGIAQCLQRDRT